MTVLEDGAGHDRHVSPAAATLQKPAPRWPGLAVAASKIAAVVLAAVCIKLNRSHLLRYVNYWFAGVVVWNLLNILIA